MGLHLAVALICELHPVLHFHEKDLKRCFTKHVSVNEVFLCEVQRRLNQAISKSFPDDFHRSACPLH